MRVEGKPELRYRFDSGFVVLQDSTKRVGQLIYQSLQIRMRVYNTRSNS